MDINIIYQRLPRSVQDVIISAYGAAQYRLKYTQSLEPPYDYLSSGSVLSGEDVKTLRHSRLTSLLRAACNDVPFYREVLSRRGFSWRDVHAENYQELLPVLEKEEVIKMPRSFYSERYKSGALQLFTSGTSGSPLPILCSRQARRINYAFYESLLKKFDCDPRDKSATFAGRMLLSRTEEQAFWRYDRFSQTMYCSSYHLSEATLQAYFDALASWSPRYIDSYPSAISEIARFMLASGQRLPADPKVIMTSSETLTHQQRFNIAQAFKCPVVDQYGCTEMAVMAWSPEPQLYNVEPLYSVVEAEKIDEDCFSLICTGLVNDAMPLIRYRIGDAVSGIALENDDQGSVISFGSVQGRIDDLITTPEGRKIGRLDPAFKGMEGVLKAQIYQTSLFDLKVRVVFAENTAIDEVVPVIKRNVRDRTSQSMNISIEAVQSIPVGPSGKFKAVISDIGDTELVV